VSTAFVTGITGQDGSYLAERLIGAGVAVHGLVQSVAESAAFLEQYPDVTLHPGDLTDTELISGLVADIRPDEVYNLAGISSVAVSWQQPVLTGRVTGLGAVGVMQACLQLQEQLGRPVRVLQASSAEIFGNPAEVPQRETTLLRPSTPYGAAKAYAHQMAAVLRSRGLPVATVILYNHESPRRPEQFVTRRITAAAARIARGEQDRLSLGNLSARRDWGWAPDYVDAMMRAIRFGVADDYIVATGQSHTVAEFVAAAFTAAGIRDWESLVDVDQSLVRVGDAAEQRGDASKARSVLGWQPSVSFEELVAAMVSADLS
jgi:GDPmannose 4,6-dehydratase